MSEDTHYYWVNGQVVISDQIPTLDGVPVDCDDAPCLDASATRPQQRYGYYNSRNSWQSMKYEDFPPQFKLSLLLLGVS